MPTHCAGWQKNLRAELESYKVANVVEYRFALLNCRPVVHPTSATVPSSETLWLLVWASRGLCPTQAISSNTILPSNHMHWFTQPQITRQAQCVCVCVREGGCMYVCPFRRGWQLSGWLGGSFVSVVARGMKSQRFDAGSPCASVAQWGVTLWTANNCDFHHVAVLSRRFTHRGGV